MHWLALLVNNRRFDLSTPIMRQGFYHLSKNFLLDVSNYDLIKGYRADDSYFSFAEAFLSNQISYKQLHEAPKEKFSDVMNELIQRKNQERGTNLHRLRKAAGLTQKELSELSGVNLRTLQQYEIGLKDINHASGAAINALALALRCNFYDVMELDLNE